MRRLRLSGWTRLWIIVSLVWAIWVGWTTWRTWPEPGNYPRPAHWPRSFVPSAETAAALLQEARAEAMRESLLLLLVPPIAVLWGAAASRWVYRGFM